MKPPAPRRIGLQIKITLGLLVISIIPLAVSAYVIDQIAKVSELYASNEAASVRAPLVKAAPIYRQLVETKKDLYLQTVQRYAATARVAAMVDNPKDPSAQRYLTDMLASVPELYRAQLLSADGDELLEAHLSAPVGVSERYSAKEMTAPIEGTDARLRLTFAADDELPAELENLGRELDRFKHRDAMRASLPEGYRMTFLLVVGGVVVIVTLAGIILSSRITRRIAVLVSGTRRVAGGHLEPVDLRGRDELAELAAAFNRMVEDLQHDREQIAYLQRIGAWQEVARKLAHEIKNPLTPIQLAVQQCVSSYKGDDQRYQSLLSDAEEIVSEEIASLRRLVDAFRTLGQLPKVAAEPLDLATIMEDIERDPVLNERLELDAPDEAVMVRGDRLLLRRVLTNLVENGQQAGASIGRTGRVIVTWYAEAKGERAVITVDDEGPGITPDTREKIFEPYVTTKEQGTGLGLTISKKIALDHHGALDVMSQPSPLGGARFRLMLPLADREEPSESA